MSRGLTSAQVVELGEYLKPDFDPSTLTISQLRGVLNHHNINFPSSQTKPKLVQVFNEEIKPKAKKFTKERIKRENSNASEDGIIDGVTGRPLNEGKQLKVRRSGRLSKTPAPEEIPLPEPSAAKRRRATAEPTMGGPSRKRASSRHAEPTVVEESEPEEEPVVRKVGRPKKTAADAGTQARRAALPMTDDPESGWEDNNVFQDSSSPVRPSPVRTRARKSSAPARPLPKTRKSMSAPPDTSSSPTKDKGKQKERFPSIKPPQSAFEPDLPPSVFQKRQLSVVRDLKEEEAEPEPEPEPEPELEPYGGSLEATSAPESAEAVPADEEEDESEEKELTGVVNAVAQRIADGGSLAKPEPSEETPGSGWLPSVTRVLITLLLISLSGVTYQFKQESTQIGFCDTSSSTNAILEGFRAKRLAIESCNRENRTTLYESDSSTPTPSATPSSAGNHDDAIFTPELCPPPPIFPSIAPDECTPCPKHATCTSSSITCENSFVLRPHPLLGFLRVPAELVETPTGLLHKYTRSSPVLNDTNVSRLVHSVLSYVFDGIPSLGPVAFPPRCVEDPLRKRHIGSIGRSIVSILANERGRRLCEGVGMGLPTGDESTEARRWGIDVEKLREHLKGKTAPSMMTAFDNAFDEAIREILQYSKVFMGEDTDGKRYLSHETPVMSIPCQARVWVRELWYEWRLAVSAVSTFILTVLYARRRRTRKALEEEQASTYARIALDSLRNQEMAHHTDPVLVPRPYLSSLQLRDLILQDVHSVKERQRLWKGVERRVEANTNVQTNDREVEGGDEQRVWEWVGTSGKTLPPGTPGLGGRIVA